MSKLLILRDAPSNGFEHLIGTYWVLMSDGKRLRHTTERQAQITITLAKGKAWSDFFEEAK